MIFSLTSKRTMSPSVQPMSLNKITTNYVMSQKTRQVITLPSQPAPIPIPYHVNKTMSKQMKWGEPVWFFLHTISHKIKDDSFVQMRSDLLKYIYTICTNLPCPDCSNHAKTYLNGINFNNIKTKTDLQIMLFEFHNSVNARKGFVEFPLIELTLKYESANLSAMTAYFITAFMDKHSSPRMISDDLYRSRITQTIKAWMTANITHFDP